VTVAKDFLMDLAKQGLVVGPIKDVVLEEVKNLGLGSQWVITLGYRIPSPFDNLQGVLASLRQPHSDYFKVFVVDRHTGEIVSMKNRDPERD
jgi:hypothetical protein